MRKIEWRDPRICVEIHIASSENSMNLLDKKPPLYIVNHLFNLWSNLG